MKEQFKKYCNKYVAFSDIEIDEIYTQFTCKTVNKNEFILKEGQTCQSHFFVTKGLLRSFYIDPKGKEKITQFALENWWITNMESFTKETPSRSYIQAIDNTEILLINKNNLEKLYISHPKLERLFRLVTEELLINVQRRHDFYLEIKSKSKYDSFAKFFPNFMQRVPQYMIASYLKITPEYLSELRKVK